jgi:gliding motility-associated-like protein
MDTALVTIGINPKPAFGPDKNLNICTGASTDLTQQYSLQGLTVNWTTGGVPVTNPTNISGAGIYQVIGTNTAGCKDTANITVVIKPKPNIGADQTVNVCYNHSTDISNLYNTTGLLFNWWVNGHTVSNVSAVSVTGDYQLTVSNSFGCLDTAVVHVIILPPVQAYAGSDTVGTSGEPMQLYASGGVSYSWTPAQALNNSMIADPIAILYNDSTRFYVEVKDIGGCIGHATVLVRTFLGSGTYYVPSAFSPNGDGLNDIFRPIPVGIVSTDLFAVYNRYGQKIFESSKYLEGWDGTFKGEKQPVGNYVWILRGVAASGKVVERKGNVVLVR